MATNPLSQSINEITSTVTEANVRRKTIELVCLIQPFSLGLLQDTFPGASADFSFFADLYDETYGFTYCDFSGDHGAVIGDVLYAIKRFMKLHCIMNLQKQTFLKLSHKQPDTTPNPWFLWLQLLTIILAIVLVIIQMLSAPRVGAEGT